MSHALASHSHAIVLGGSVAGLIAARVLADHFDRVTVLERDVPKEEDEPRRGVPQGRHVHAMLIRGHRIIEGLFPGYTAWAVEQGATTINIGEEAAWHLFGAWRPRYRSELNPLAASRPLLERGVRHFALKHPRIVQRVGCEVSELITDETRTMVRGVRFHDDSAAPDAPEQELRADVVVDATGRASRTPKMLEALGLPTPAEVVISSGAAYATRMFRFANRPRGWKMCYVQPTTGEGTRGAIAVPVEGGRYLVTLIGMAGDAPPTTEEGFLAFAESLPVPDFANLLRDATPLSPIYGFARAENRRRTYDRLSRHLDGLFVLGDANLAFNPVYGQGMTAAAIGGETLGKLIASARKPDGIAVRGLSGRFQRQLNKNLATAWQMATGEDLRWLAAKEARSLPLGQRALNGFVDAIQRASLRSPLLCEAFYRVAQMLDEPTALFKPAVLAELAFGARSPKPAELTSSPPGRYSPAAS